MAIDVHIDFETRSKADLKKIGAYKYSLDESTSIMCMFYTIGDLPPKRWLQGDSIPNDLLDAANDDIFVFTAHNAFFEQCIWNNILHKKHGFPTLGVRRWKCTAAKAAAHALPRDLKGVGEALDLPVKKDESGKRIMLKMSKPRKPTKNDPSEWHESEEDKEKLYSYCRDDVIVERYIDNTVRDLKPSEQELWYLDQEMNFKGVQADIEAVEGALKLIEIYKEDINFKGDILTSGDVSSIVTQRDRLLTWVHNQGCQIPDMTADTLDLWISENANNVPPDVYRALVLRRLGSKASLKKYDAMQRSICEDGRIRDLLMFHAASTGRWGGKFFQIHNLPRGHMDKIAKNAFGGDVDAAIEYIISAMKRADKEAFDELEIKSGFHPFDIFVSAIRNVLIAKPDHTLMVADYSAIEAVVLAWLADDTELLTKFKNKEPVYESQAAVIYDKRVEDITKDERALGKVSILGAGYMMGAPRFVETCEQFGISLSTAATKPILKSAINKRISKIEAKYQSDLDKWSVLSAADRKGKSPPKDISSEIQEYRNLLCDVGNARTNEEAANKCDGYDHLGLSASLLMAEYVINVYRTSRKPIVNLWYEVEDAAIAAVTKAIEGEAGITTCAGGRVKWFYDKGYLYCKLPSGRCLAYYDPELKLTETPWGAKKYQLSYMGVDSMTKKWRRTTTYGGHIVENITQAIARDILANAVVNCHKSGKYDVVFHVHDELVAEVPNDGTRSIKEFIGLMLALPAWGADIPLSAEGFESFRYKK